MPTLPRLWIALLGLLLTFFSGKATLVTFRVDLSQQAGVSPNSIHIVGSFNNWNPAATPMDSLGAGRYEWTENLTAGSVATYKFVNGDTWGEEEGVFGECAFNTYRFLRVPLGDTVLPWVCFQYCDSACTPAAGTRIACVGNSITWGWDLPDKITQSYPAILEDSLGASFLVENFGAPGSAVIRHAGNPYFRTEQFRALMRFGPTQAILSLGTNDSKSAIWGALAADFTKDYDTLWMSMDTMANLERLWICTPPTAFSGLFGVDENVLGGQIVPLIRAHARLHCLDQIDIHGFTASLGAYFPDGVHPDTTGTRLIANEVYRILQLPRPQIAVTGQTLTAVGGYDWQWYFNGDTLPSIWGGRSQNLVFAPSGIYKVGVQIDSLFQHVLISDSLAFNAVGIADAQADAMILFPDPANQVLNWHCEDAGLSSAILRVYSMSGKLELETLVEGNEGSLDIAMLARGNYVFELSGNDLLVRKLFSKI